jgi:hypothetical protein
MKQFSFIHILLFILKMIVYHCSHAQDYVIPLRGDTIKGSIRPEGVGALQRVQVTPSEGKKKSYGVVEVREYKYKGEIYRPIRGVSGYVFMKLLKDGYLALYGFQPENQSNYDGRCLVKRDASTMEVPNLTFKKSLTRYLSDCPTVAEKIDKGEYSKRDVEAIVDAYNSCVAKNSEAVNVQAKQLNPLDALEQKVKSKSAFAGQSDALDMISEIRNKIQRNEKIPNFMIEGLKKSLSTETDLSVEIDAALKELAK